MFENYIILAWRNLRKGSVYSIVNIAGLAIGLACALAIGLFIQEEYSYDRFHKHADNIYRVVQRQDQAGVVYDIASSPGPMGEALKADFPEVINSCVLGYRRTGVLQYETVTVESNAITMADPGFLKMFSFSLVLGSPDRVFTEPNQVVITDRMAVNLFGSNWKNDTQLLGKTIRYSRRKNDRIITDELVLAGVVMAPPSNSHLQFEVALTYDPKHRENISWNSNNFLTYIQLAPDANPAALNRKLVGYIDRYVAPQTRSFKPPVFYLQPLTDIHLQSDFDFQTDWTKTSSIVYVQIFAAVGIMVLMIAVFNYINLSTARAIRRAKEVGIRKSVGAHRWQLMIQFLTESLLITVLSIGIALVLVNIGLPFLNVVASKSLVLPVTAPGFGALVIVFILSVSVIAGFYPAVYLSGFQPAKVLKGIFSIHSGKRFRQLLIVTQFTVTVILVAASLVIFKQLFFLRNKDLGFDKEQLIYLETNNLSQGQEESLKLDLLKQHEVLEAALTSNNLIDVISSTVSFEWEGKSPDDKFLITRLNIDPEYLDATGIKLIAGRNFNPDILTDTIAYLINASAARRMGWTPEEALGKDFKLYEDKGAVIGVVEDFHFRPLTAAIEPLVFTNMPSRDYSGIMIKVAVNQLVGSISLINKLYRKYDPVIPAHFSFIDQQLESQYRFEQSTGKIVILFAVLANFVAFLGLYGMAAFNADRRVKEIGIRKVMGASPIHVSELLSKDFGYLVILSIILAVPISYFLLRSWLQVFVYRIEMDWPVFVVAGAVPLIMAFLTVLHQGIVSARMNPVKSLRSE